MEITSKRGKFCEILPFQIKRTQKYEIKNEYKVSCVWTHIRINTLIMPRYGGIPILRFV